MEYRSKPLFEKSPTEAQRSIDKKRKSLENAIANFRKFIDNLPPRNVEINQSFSTNLAQLEGQFNKNYTEAQNLGIDASPYYDQYMEVINPLEEKAAITSIINPQRIHPVIEELRKEIEKEDHSVGYEAPMYKLTTYHCQKMFVSRGMQIIMYYKLKHKKRIL